MRKFVPYVLFLLGLILLVGAVWYGWHTLRTPAVPQADVPATLAGVMLTEKVTGAEAVAQIQSLHLSALTLSDGIVAVYGTQAVVVWIAATESSAQAAALTADMETNIANGGSSFTPLSVLTLGGRDVYEAEGLGQLHFYFQSGNKVVWLSADQGVAEQALSELMNYYPLSHRATFISRPVRFIRLVPSPL